MSRERELLERTIEEWDSDRDLYEFHKVIEEIRDFLSTPKPEQDEEPIGVVEIIDTDEDGDAYAWVGLYQSVNLGDLLYLHPAPRKQDEEPVARLHITETDTYPVIDVEVLNGEMLQPSMSPINVYTIQQKPFVRLSEEEVKSLTYAPYEPYELICAVENRLVEKNRG